LEQFESRITPTATLTFTDIDGDKVQITSSKGTSSDLHLAAGFDGAGDLVLLDLSQATWGGKFAGANIAISVTKVGVTGDGLIDVGNIDATGTDLGAVAIHGDLGKINAGSIQSLSVRSMGRVGLDSQGGAGDLNSNIAGGLGSLHVSGDVIGEFIIAGSIGTVTIGGSLIGDSRAGSGHIRSGNNIGAVKIGGDVDGGTGNLSGVIWGENIASISIGGSVIGGADANSSFNGLLKSDLSMGPVRIGHDLLGGSSIFAGNITVGTTLASLTVGGSIVGGTATESGEVRAFEGMGPVRIGHDLVGGSISGSASLVESGDIICGNGRIASVFIGGSIISGIDDSSGALADNASIRAGHDIGSLTVKGNIIGNLTPNGESRVEISAVGQKAQGTTTDLAIGTISVGGSVERADFAAGYDAADTPKNADAQVGAVTVGGDWVASNLIAGVVPGGDGLFGTVDDKSINGAGTTNNPNIVSKISSVVIAGGVFGTPTSESSTDHFGFDAQWIASFKYGGVTVSLKPGADNDGFSLFPPGDFAHKVGSTGDVTVREV
jgi:hypothetical protein